MKGIKVLSSILMTLLISGCSSTENLYEVSKNTSQEEITENVAENNFLLNEIYFDLANKLHQGEKLTNQYVVSKVEDFEVVSWGPTNKKMNSSEFIVKNNKEEFEMLYQENVSDYMDLIYSIKDAGTKKSISYAYNVVSKSPIDNFIFNMESSNVKEQSNILKKINNNSEFLKTYEYLSDKMASNKGVSIEDIRSSIKLDYDYSIHNQTLDNSKTETFDKYTFSNKNESISILYLKDTDIIYNSKYEVASKQTLSITNESVLDKNKEIYISIRCILNSFEEQKTFIN